MFLHNEPKAWFPKCCVCKRRHVLVPATQIRSLPITTATTTTTTTKRRNCLRKNNKKMIYCTFQKLFSLLSLFPFFFRYTYNSHNKKNRSIDLWIILVKMNNLYFTDFNLENCYLWWIFVRFSFSSFVSHLYRLS